MDKIKVNIVIFGNLSAREVSWGGGELSVCDSEEIGAFFDISGAVKIIGNVTVDIFNIEDQQVLVVGEVLEGGME